MALSPDTDAPRLAAIRDLAIEVWRLLVPARRGPQPSGVERPWRAPVEPEQLVAVHGALRVTLAARTAPPPDVWGATELAEDGTQLGFDKMGASEIVDRLIARALNLARSTAWRRVQELRTHAADSA